jgi:hypothetical protein
MPNRPSHRWTIDAIEAGMARIEEDGEKMITVPVYLLPTGVHEGQILVVTTARGREKGALDVTVAVDEKATSDSLARSKATVARAMARSRKRDAGGDVAL